MADTGRGSFAGTNAAPTFVIRPAAARDLPALGRLARRLNTANLPPEPAELEEMLERSTRSFAGKVRDRATAAYVFVAESTRSGKVAGASVIVAKHGTPDSPHYYLEMTDEERYSKGLRRLFRHTYLQLRRSFDGPTEVGGLVVHPTYRGRAEKVGKQLSYVRFLYMGLHPDRFEPAVLAEMLPPLTPAGKSAFWECFGRCVTGLSFHEADLLSRHDKEFIDALFPEVPIYLRMLPEAVRKQLGVVGPQSRPALRLLERIGFRFLRHVDPFDGGPYYGARLEEIALVRALQRRRVRVAKRSRSPGSAAGEDVLVACASAGGLRAVRIRAHIRDGEIELPAAATAALGAKDRGHVAVVPFL